MNALAILELVYGATVTIGMTYGAREALKALARDRGVER